MRKIYAHLTKIYAQNLTEIYCNYSSPVLNCFAFVHFKNLLTISEKQLNWAVKACCFHRFNSSSLSIRLDNYILPIKQLLEYRTALYVNQLLTFEKPAFRRITGLSLPTYNFYGHSRRKNIFLEERSKKSWLDKGIIRRGLSLNNCYEKSVKRNESDRRLKKVFKS